MAATGGNSPLDSLFYYFPVLCAIAQGFNLNFAYKHIGKRKVFKPLIPIYICSKQTTGNKPT